MKTQTLYLVRGLPGSGKSTIARDLVDNGLADVQVEADMWMYNDRGEYEFSPSLVKHAHGRCQAAVRKCLRRGESVAVSNTFTQRWELQPYINMAEYFGVKVKEITARGEFGSIHNVPDDVIQAMRDRWQD